MYTIYIYIYILCTIFPLLHGAEIRVITLTFCYNGGSFTGEKQFKVLLL